MYFEAHDMDDGIKFLLKFGFVAYKMRSFVLWDNIYQVLRNLTINCSLNTSMNNLIHCNDLSKLIVCFIITYLH